MKKQLFVGAATLAVLGAGVSQAQATKVIPLRTGEADEVVVPWLVGTIDVQGVAQEAPGPGLGLSIINAECTATLYALGEKQYQGINKCFLKDLTTGTVYNLLTVAAEPNDVVAAGSFTVLTSHAYAICPGAEFIENTANLGVGPECATMTLSGVSPA
jgi:hypothetical protein